MRAVIAVVLMSSTAFADELPRLEGRVVDQSGVPVEGAIVMISGPNGLAQTLTTDSAGWYAAALAPATYNVIFAYGKSRTSGRVVVDGDATLDGKIDAKVGEVIVIRETVKQPVGPQPTNFNERATPPYSDKAILGDVWTKAHMLLDIDENGVVRRFKFLKRPGYDLDPIAERVVTNLKFAPARDRSGKPFRARLVWTIEWPSAWWLEKYVGTRSTMPPIVGFPPHRLDTMVACKGSGPWKMDNGPWETGSAHYVYRDCSQPDLRKASEESWIDAK